MSDTVIVVEDEDGDWEEIEADDEDQAFDEAIVSVASDKPKQLSKMQESILKGWKDYP